MRVKRRQLTGASPIGKQSHKNRRITMHYVHKSTTLKEEGLVFSASGGWRGKESVQESQGLSGLGFSEEQDFAR